MKLKDRLTRRDFLKFSALTIGGLAFNNHNLAKVLVSGTKSLMPEPIKNDFPVNQLLGRICVGEWGTRVPIRSEPYMDAPAVGSAWHDDVFVWKREVIAKQLDPLRINQRWVETPDGYIYADDIQKVWHIPQEPLTELPEMPDGSRGMWVEITTPYVDIDLTKPKESYQWWVKDPNVIYPRVRYSQVYWAFDIRKHPETVRTQYCLMQKVGAFPDTYWVDAHVCKPIMPEDISPINPEAENKHILIQMRGIGLQTLTCFEGNQEVFFTTVTTGGRNFETGEWITPIGKHTPWRKNISMHYSQDGRFMPGFDLPGVAWNFGIEPNGVYIHSTYWHNAFGNMKSNGCINCRPEDAKWIWRWVDPTIPYQDGDKIWSGFGVSTPVTVEILS
jgi:hypothetical protein